MRQAFRAKLPNSDAWLFPNNLWIAATVVGGMLWELYAEARAVYRTLPDQARESLLMRWGNLYRVYQQMPQTASGIILLTGQPDTPVPAGTQWRRADAVLYTLNDDAALDDDGRAAVQVTCEASGSSGNALAGSPLTLATSVDDLDDGATVGPNGIGGGADIEETEDYRARVLARMAHRNRYGTLQDYVDWALEVPGVTRAWAQAAGPRILVWFMMDNAYPDTWGIPQQADAVIVDAYLTDPCRKPVGAVPMARVPGGVALELTLRCPRPFSEAIRVAVGSALNSYLRRNAAPGHGYMALDIQRVIDSAASFDYSLAQSVWRIDAGSIFTHAVVTWEAC